MTSPECRNGTERCAEALAQLHEPDLVINFQGDALLTPPGFVEALIARMDDDQRCAGRDACDAAAERRGAGAAGGGSARAGSAGRPSSPTTDGHALYFSKRLIPHLPAGALDGELSPVRLHVGVYAYRPEALDRYAATPVSELETLEGLEQLRFLAAGVPVAVVDVADAAVRACASSTIPRMSRRSSRRSPRRASNELLGRAGPQVPADPVRHLGRRSRRRDALSRARRSGWCSGASEGRCVVLLTNAPRTAEAVEQQLARIGLAARGLGRRRDQRRGGDRGAERARQAGRVHRHGRRPRDPEGQGSRDRRCARISPTSRAPASTRGRPDPQDYRADLERWAERDVHMHCLNPDRLVIRGGVPEACAGAIADIYAMLGGRVTWYGKPYPGDLRACAAPCRQSAEGRGARGRRRAADRHPRRRADGLRRRVRHRRNSRRRAVPGGFRRAKRPWRVAAGGGRRRRSPR